MSHFSVLVLTKPHQTVDELLAPFDENVNNLPDELLEFVPDNDYDVDDRAGQRGYWRNPSAKWDWWKIGGRWDGAMRSRNPPVPVVLSGNSAHVRDLVPRCMGPTFAVVTPDGEWHARGKMGWFGVMTDERFNVIQWEAEFKRLLDEAEPDWIATIVDCHI